MLIYDQPCSLVTQTANVKAVQVFYTDSSSDYEMYRACIEGSFCHNACTSQFSSYAEQMKPDIKFLNVSVSTIDMYVNLEMFSVRRFDYIACCKFVVVEPYTFRAVPGENALVDDTVKLHQFFLWEFSGSGDIALDVEKLYSVLMVDPDAVSPQAKQLPYGHLLTANLKYQDVSGDCLPDLHQRSRRKWRRKEAPQRWNFQKKLFKLRRYWPLHPTRKCNITDHYAIVNTIMPYAGPTPQNQVEHTYYILLFSHEKPLKTFPNDFYKDVDGCERRCKWDLSKLPADFKLRGINRFRAKTDDYTLQIGAGDPDAPCAAAGSSSPTQPPTPCHPTYVDYRAVPSLAIKLTYEGSLMESADPENPDFDYDDGTQKANDNRTQKANNGSVLTSWGTLWLIVFGVRSLVEIQF